MADQPRLSKTKLALTRLLPGHIGARLRLLIALALLPVMLLLAWINVHFYRTQRTQTLATELEVAQGVGMAFQSYVDEVRRDNVAVGQTIVTYGLHENDRVRNVLIAAAIQNLSIQNMNWLSPEGRVLVSSQPESDGRDLFTSPPVKRVMNGAPWAIGDLLPQDLGEDHPVSYIVTAIRDKQGLLLGMVVATVDPERMGELSLTQKRPAGGAYAIFDHQGTLVYRSPETRLSWAERVTWKKTDAVLSRVLQKGQPFAGVTRLEVQPAEWICARAPIAEFGWVSGAARPARQTLTAVHHAVLQNLLLALSVLIIAFILATLIARTIAYPLLRLERQAQAMGDGADVEAEDDPLAPAEVLGLRTTMATMAVGLIEHAEALRENEVRYRSLVEALSQIVWQTNVRGEVTREIPAWQEYTGQSAAEVRGWGWLNAIDPDDRERVIAVWNRSVATLGRYEIEYRLRRRDGVWRHVMARGVPVPARSGEIDEYIGICIDITAQREAEAELARGRELLAQAEKLSHTGAWEWDLVTGVWTLTDEWLAIHGCAKPPLTFEELMPLAHPDDREKVVRALALVREKGEPYDLEHRIVRQDNGQTRVVKVYGQSMPNVADEVTKIYGFVQDITERKESEERLRKSEARFTSALENLAEGLVIATETAELIYWNPSARVMHGLSAPEEGFGPLLRYTEVFQLWTPDSRRMLSFEEWPMARIMRGETVKNLELRLKRLDQGWERVFSYSGTMVETASGERMVLLSIYDLTEQRKAEEELRQSEARFRAFFESNIIGIMFGDVDGRIYDCNDELARIIGRGRQEVPQGKVHWPAITPPEDLPLDEQAIVEAQATGRCTPYEKHYIRPDGTLVPVVIGYTLLDPDRSHSVAFVLDISDRKRMEDALREADRRKDEFLAMLAHELRNPLAPVRNAVQILNMVGPADPVLQRQRAIIDRQVAHMARLLDDLLDVSRITRDKITLQRQRLHLSDVLLQAVETARPLIDKRHHTLEYLAPPDELCVEGDMDRLAQIFGNLLTNAAKYTEEGGRIWLRAWRQNDEAIISVRDTGVGIAPEMLPRVFELFTQGDRSLDRSQSGLGIGLTMVKRLTEMHGGSVDVCSDGLGKGAIFAVRLPALATESCRREVMPAAPGDLAPQSTRQRLMVVDDVADSAYSLGELLELWGHPVRVAHDGPMALDLFREFRPDVVLLDIGMPGMNGYEVARRLRAEYGAGPVLVAMTGYGQPQDREETRAAGFNEHLVKPVDLEQLRSLLDRYQS